MVYTSTRLKNPTIIAMPLREDEVEKYSSGFSDLYLLYRNERGEIEIGIPSMQKYFPETGNMYGSRMATQKAYFYCGASKLKSEAQEVTDRPVYEIYPSDDRKVENYKILNDVDVDLDSVVNGTYVVGSQRL